MGSASKGAEFLTAIEQLQRQGYRQLIVFYQYTDTVDALKQLLIGAGRTSLMCFTGRGGELMQHVGGWESLNREAIRHRFRDGEAELLLCTDAAAEGLNFQFCGALINNDTPWNPMRVEQRIRRIDRIGKTHDQMQSINLPLDGTVEADVYRAPKARIASFESIVGTLQPILAKASSSIAQATLASRQQRERARSEAVAWPAEVHGQSVRASVLCIDDGDTLRVLQTDGQPLTVRLACIDAPETAQSTWGQQARAYLQQRLPIGREVSLEAKATDRDGRTVAEVIADININLALVEDGLAFVYRQYLDGCDAGDYLEAEYRASRHRHGVWQMEGGITRSWDVRRRHWSAPRPDGTTAGGHRYRCWEFGSHARAQELLAQGHNDCGGNGELSPSR